MSDQSRRVALTAVSVCLGIMVGCMTDASAWADVPAPLTWVAAASALVMAATVATRRLPLISMAGIVAVSVLATLWSAAVGASWASATWWPIVLMVVVLGQASTGFLLGLTATVLMMDASTLVVFRQMGVHGTSGSVQYFVGFVGVIAAPLWFRLTHVEGTSLARRGARFGALSLVALAVWAAFASGSRAAVIGLGTAALVGLATHFLVGGFRQAPWRATFGRIFGICVLLVGIDVGLGFIFGDGRSTAFPVISEHVSSSTAQVESGGEALGGIRLPLWRQAAIALVARPYGHGPGSYGHVNHAYQFEPMLWSGSPHSVWALTAVETGVPGLIALLALVGGGLYCAARRGSPSMAALLGSTVVMSLDVFASMPVQSLVWWAVIGAAWGPTVSKSGVRRLVGTALLAGTLVFGLYFSIRLSSDCIDDCDPIARYGGHPRLTGSPAIVVGEDPEDPRWNEWKARFPLAFWLAFSETSARSSRDATAMLDLLRAYPFQSAQTFVDVADSFAEEGALGDTAARAAEDIASCGLVRFFDGRTIHRDWRAAGTELVDQRQALERHAGEAVGDEAACVRAGIPDVAIGLQ